MNDLQKLQNVFGLIRLLNTPPARTAKRLMNILDVKKSQFYRYKKLLEDVGYKIHTDEQHRMSIEMKVSKYGNDLLLPDELEHLENVLRQVSGNHPLTTTLLNKFNANLSLIPLADALPHLHATRNIQLIRTALNRKKKLILRRYQSFTSETTLDRTIEPLELTADYKFLKKFTARSRKEKYELKDWFDQNFKRAFHQHMITVPKYLTDEIPLIDETKPDMEIKYVSMEEIPNWYLNSIGFNRERVVDLKEEKNKTIIL